MFSPEGNIAPAVESRLIQVAEEHLSVQFPDAVFEIEVRWLPSRLQSLAETQAIEQIRFRSGGVPKGLVTAEVATGRNRYTTQMFLQTHINVPVLNRAVEQGDTITEDMVAFEKVEVTHFNRLPVEQIRYGEQMARRPLGSGTPLYEHDLMQILVINRGDQVVMSYHINGLNIEFNCESRQDGAAGDTITVHCRESGKRYQGIVLKKGMVEWKKTY